VAQFKWQVFVQVRALVCQVIRAISERSCRSVGREQPIARGELDDIGYQLPGGVAEDSLRKLG
jgi:hypothetical protein